MLFFVFDILAVFFAILCAAFRSVRKEDQRRAKEIELAGITASDGNRNRDHERESAKDKHERSPFFFPLTSFHLLPTTTLKKKKTLNPIPLPKKTQIFRLAFGPKVFIVVSDPELTKQVLVTDAANYSKGLLSEILDFVMGQGLIPADGDVWRERRRAVVPALHRRYIESMLGMFGDSALHGAAVLERQMGGGEGGGGGGGGGGGSDGGGASSASLHHNPSSSSSSPSPSVVVEIENFFSRLTLDIIGKAVFNYDFGSLKNDDPFIQAVYTALREAEYRSTAFVPYWNFAPLRWLVREREGVFFSLFYFFLEVKKENQTKRKQTHIFSSLELPLPPPPQKKKKKKQTPGPEAAPLPGGPRHHQLDPRRPHRQVPAPRRLGRGGVCRRVPLGQGPLDPPLFARRGRHARLEAAARRPDDAADRRARDHRRGADVDRLLPDLEAGVRREGGEGGGRGARGELNVFLSLSFFFWVDSSRGNKQRRLQLVGRLASQSPSGRIRAAAAEAAPIPGTAPASPPEERRRAGAAAAA